jgi:NAD-dependent DNA ligase
VRLDGRDVLRTLLGEGVRVQRRQDGSFGLIPSDRVTPDLLQLARDAKPQITAIVSTIPAPNACEVCGSPTGWNDGKTQTKCVGCASIVAERWFLDRGLPTPRDISREIAERGLAA